MYIIVAYDVGVERCNKVMKILRKYLFHRQNSVFEGNITHKELRNLKEELRLIVNDVDEIIFYELLSNKYLYNSYIGKKNAIKQII